MAVAHGLPRKPKNPIIGTKPFEHLLEMTIARLLWPQVIIAEKTNRASCA